MPRGEWVARAAFRKTPRMIANFEKVFGHPYAFPKYAQTVVPDFTFGGMENTSATTLFDRMLDMPNDSLDEGYDMLIAHERRTSGAISSPAATGRRRGFTRGSPPTRRSWRARTAPGGRTPISAGSSRCSYLVEDGCEYRRALVERRYEYPNDIFDRHLYEKGALVLHALRAALGDDAWRRSLKRYVRKHAFGSVETADLRRACEDETGRNLAWFFDQWVHAGGHRDRGVAEVGRTVPLPHAHDRPEAARGRGDARLPHPDDARGGALRTRGPRRRDAPDSSRSASGGRRSRCRSSKPATSPSIPSTT